MSVNANSLTIGASMGWAQASANAGFDDSKQGPSTTSFTATPSATTYSEVYLAQFTIAASANVTKNFNSFVNAFATTITATKILGILVKATGATGIMKIEPAPADNPLTWFLSGTTPAITLNCGTDGCGLMVCDGSAFTMSGTVKNWKISNTGAATITVTISAIVGP